MLSRHLILLVDSFEDRITLVHGSVVLNQPPAISFHITAIQNKDRNNTVKEKHKTRIPFAHFASGTDVVTKNGEAAYTRRQLNVHLSQRRFLLVPDIIMQVENAEV